MIYLDSAATTFQKPPAVAAAMEDALRNHEFPGPGRVSGGHAGRRYRLCLPE